MQRSIRSASQDQNGAGGEHRHQQHRRRRLESAAQANRPGSANTLPSPTPDMNSAAIATGAAPTAASTPIGDGFTAIAGASRRAAATGWQARHGIFQKLFE